MDVEGFQTRPSKPDHIPQPVTVPCQTLKVPGCQMKGRLQPLKGSRQPLKVLRRRMKGPRQTLKGSRQTLMVLLQPMKGSHQTLKSSRQTLKVLQRRMKGLLQTLKGFAQTLKVFGQIMKVLQQTLKVLVRSRHCFQQNPRPHSTIHRFHSSSSIPSNSCPHWEPTRCYLERHRPFPTRQTCQSLAQHQSHPKWPRPLGSRADRRLEWRHGCME